MTTWVRPLLVLGEYYYIHQNPNPNTQYFCGLIGRIIALDHPERGILLTQLMDGDVGQIIITPDMVIPLYRMGWA